jgi:hypothetical protein
VKEMLKSRGQNIPGSKAKPSEESGQFVLDAQDDSLMDRSDVEGIYGFEDELSNSGITHSEVAALNGSYDQYDDGIVIVVRNLKRFKTLNKTIHFLNCAERGRGGLPIRLFKHQPILAEPQRTLEPPRHRLSDYGWPQHCQSGS